MTDVRRFRRVPFLTTVTVASGATSWPANLVDIALKGALVEMNDAPDLPLGRDCHLSLSLPETSVTLDFEAKLVHREGNRYGFRFCREDLQTLTHLRKLIELNTGDAETTRLELVDWLRDQDCDRTTTSGPD
ncbi:MAG: PilZ domain-containing protein [Desulfuromonadales bacterium]|nr:PilZ domain-containing protein [Desulfuromonadales bacterium]